MRVFPITATLLALTAGSPALAVRPVVVAADSVRTRHVSYADLNLASLAGVSTLYGRVRSAAADLCDDGATSDFMIRAVERSCFEEAVLSAAAQIEDAVLAAERPSAAGRLATLERQ